MPWAIESTRHTTATPAEIFRYYAEPSTWGDWGHNTRWARADGPVGEGSIVRVKAGYGAVYPVLVRRFVPGTVVECEVRPRGLLVVNRYLVEPAQGGARVRHEIEVAGRFEGFTRVLLRGLYRRLLGKETRKLVALAEAGPPPV